MIQLLTATTLTNPNNRGGNESRYIKIELHSTKQQVKALYINPLNLDQREQKPNIKIGTEVFVLTDEFSNFFVIGSTQQSIMVEDSKIYIIENKNKVEVKTDDLFLVNSISGNKTTTANIKAVDLILDTDNFTSNTTNATFNTDKFKVTNGSDEVLSLVLELISGLKSGVWIGNLSAPVPMSDATKATLTDIETRLNQFT